MHGKRANWDDQAKPSQAPYLFAKPSAAPYLVKKTGEFPKGSRLREVLNAEAHYPDRGTRNGTEFQNWQVNDLMAEFHELEMRWVKTTDVGQKQQLEKMLQAAELKCALHTRIYCDLVRGDRSEESITREKTRHRMRTRRKAQRCIGLPKKGRASVPAKKKKKRRHRIDEDNGQVISWEEFRKENARLPPKDLRRVWKTYPRIGRPVTTRVYKGHQLTWTECLRRFGVDFDPTALYLWYEKLPRCT